MTAKLVDYIRAHDHEAWPDGADRIRVVAVYSDGTEELETIPATLGAVRAWLGY